MKEYLFLLLNLAAVLLLLRQFYDPATEYSPAVGKVECINREDSLRTMCAFCVDRPAGLPASHGFHIENSLNYLVLKLRSQEHFMSCREYLQMVDYSNSLAAIALEQQQSVGEVVRELQGEVAAVANDVHAVGSEFAQFVVYRWFGPAETRTFNVRIPNPEQGVRTHRALFYLLNAVLLLTAIAWFVDASFLTALPNTVKYTLGALTVVLELVSWGVLGEGWSGVGRMLLVAASLYKVEVHKQTVLLYMLAGVVTFLHPLLRVSYLLGGCCLMLLKGCGKLNVKSFLVFMALSHLLLASAETVSLLFFGKVGSWTCQMAELALLILTPTGFLTIPDTKVFNFREYRPSDPERRSISLSGYEEEWEEGRL